MMYKANFSFNQPTFDLLKKMMIDEFLRLRKKALPELNHYFEIWDGLYASIEYKSSQSEMERHGYSVSDMKKILSKVNESEKSKFVKIDCDEHGYLIGKNGTIILTMTLEPT